jgi:hypothetical protein
VVIVKLWVHQNPMWWRPDTEAEDSITRFLARLAERFDEDSAPFVQGFGSTFDGERRVPLVVLDKSLLVDPIKAVFDAFIGQIEDDFRRVFAALGFPVAPFDRDDVFYPLSDAGELALRLLSPFDPPGDTLVAYAARPKALKATPGDRVWGPDGEDATIGFLLNVNDRVCATTAGHLVTSMPCEISKRERRLFGVLADRVERIGQVRFYSDPRGSPGPDVALIDLVQAGGTWVQPYTVGAATLGGSARACDIERRTKPRGARLGSRRHASHDRGRWPYMVQRVVGEPLRYRLRTGGRFWRACCARG